MREDGVGVTRNRDLALLLAYPALHHGVRKAAHWSRSLFSGFPPRNKPKPPYVSFLFIVGCGRSGNTLLRRLMMEDLDIFIPPESYVLPTIASYRITARSQEWPDLVNRVVHTLIDRPGFKIPGLGDPHSFCREAGSWPAEERDIGILVQRFYGWIGREVGLPSSWAGDKTPGNTFYLSDLDSMMPGATFIYLVRDGLDVIASYLNSGLYDDPMQAAKRWKLSHVHWKHFKGKLPENRYLEIRYEDLVKDSDSCIAKIAKKFGIPFRDQKAEVIDIMGDVGNLAHHANVVGRVSPTSVGKGRKQVPMEVLNSVRKLVNPALRELGYQTV